jgi:hypothetical protein
MRKLISGSVLLLLVVSFFTVSCIAADKKTEKAVVTKSSKVEVYYFHYSRRCITCNAVESESKASIAALYPAQFKKGQITFMSVNLDEKGSEVIAAKCKAEGQSLLIISGSNRADLTDKGFMYAKSSPEKLKAEFKKAIDPLL